MVRENADGLTGPGLCSHVSVDERIVSRDASLGGHKTIARTNLPAVCEVRDWPTGYGRHQPRTERFRGGSIEYHRLRSSSRT